MGQGERAIARRTEATARGDEKGAVSFLLRDVKKRFSAPQRSDVAGKNVTSVVPKSTVGENVSPHPKMELGISVTTPQVTS